MTFQEDGNHTIEEQAAYNLNIIRKLASNTLKILEVECCPLSMKKKQYVIGTNPEKRLKELMNLYFFRIQYELSWETHSCVCCGDT